MTTPEQQPTPPGWYPDSQGAMRWWDGQQWTQQTAPAAATPGPQVVMQAPYRMVTTSKKRTSHGLHLFLTLITFGIWGLLVWLPITIIHAFQKDKQITRVG